MSPVKRTWIADRVHALDGAAPMRHQSAVEGEDTMLLAAPFGLLLLAQAANIAEPPVPGAPATSRICPPGASRDDITVCGRRNDGAGYRLPAPDRFDPAGPVDSVSRERHRLLDVGAVGTGSCSTVGPGGWTGCMFNDWRHADEQYAGRNHGHGPRATVRVGPLSSPPR
jgi:hypothetical protein